MKKTAAFALLTSPLFACTLLSGCAPTVAVSEAAKTNGGLNPVTRLSVAQPAPGLPAGTLRLSSPTMTDGGRYPDNQVANGFGCAGPNVSPALNWSGVPAGTQSLVLTKYDPDAPTGSGFWHWAVYNIPATASGLPEGLGNLSGPLADGTTQLNNDSGQPGFIGACPPPGDRAHRYVFTLYALNTTLDLPAGSSAAVLGSNLNGKVLAKTSLTAFYKR